MRDSHDKFTMEIGELPRLRGRPATGRAMTAAERQKAHRERMRIKEKRELKELETTHKERSDYELANALIDQIWLSIPGDDEKAEQGAERIWREVGRRKGWL